MLNEKDETVFWILLTAYGEGRAHRNQLMGRKLSPTGREKVRIPKCWHVHLRKGPRESFSDRRCLWYAFRHSAFEFCDDPVWMCHGWRWRVCERARARARVCAFYFRLCTCACGGVTRQSPQQSSPKVTEQREEVGQGHSQPLSLIIWASSIMNLPSLYFWLLSNACSCNRDKNRQMLQPKKLKINTQSSVDYWNQKIFLSTFSCS